jgi:hypothetical protein
MNDEPKSPRDWLLARHAAAAPQLNRRRRAALPAAPLTWHEALAALFRPHRIAWRTLAVIWLMMAIAHLAQTRASREPSHSAPPPEALAGWLRQLKTHEILAQTDRHP